MKLSFLFIMHAAVERVSSVLYLLHQLVLLLSLLLYDLSSTNVITVEMASF